MYRNNRQSDNRSAPVSTAVIPVVARKAFFAGIAKSLKRDLPADLSRFRSRGDFNLMKVWFEHYRIHYEVVIDQQIGKIEVGLHFEDGPASTLAFLALLDQRILEIKDALGPEAELERWTQSWARLYELHPLGEVNAAATMRAADRLVLYIKTLQPIVESAGIKLERPDS